MEDESYYNSLASVFEQSLKMIGKLVSPEQQNDFLGRLDEVKDEARNWGWGVRDDMLYLMKKYGFS